MNIIKSKTTTDSQISVEYFEPDFPEGLSSTEAEDSALAIRMFERNFNRMFSRLGRITLTDVEKFTDRLKNRHSENNTKTFPSFTGYNQHSYNLNTEQESYLIVKYMDNTHNSRSEHEPYLEVNKSVPVFSMYLDTYPYPNCPTISHKPKLFSWNQARSLCEQVSGVLPEFVSRASEDRLVEAIKGATTVFPIDAVYIGLRWRPRKVSVMCAFPFMSGAHAADFANWLNHL